MEKGKREEERCKMWRRRHGRALYGFVCANVMSLKSLNVKLISSCQPNKMQAGPKSKRGTQFLCAWHKNYNKSEIARE